MPGTCLFFAHNIDELPLQHAIASQFWPQQVAPLIWNGATLSIDLPPDALAGAKEILPCLAIADHKPWAYQFALQYATQTGHQGRTALAEIGPMEQVEAEQREKAVESAIDLFQIHEPLQKASLHLRVQGVDSRAPALLTVSIRVKEQAPVVISASRGTDINVPARSQMVLRPEIASHVCSPCSVAMLLDYYGRSAEIYDVIAAARHHPSQLHGVWPANIYAAARRGLLGYLLHFPSWDTARALLDKGLPIIASVRYEEGELNDAAIPRTKGHLLVVRGYKADKVLVNDPASPSNAEVSRAYDLREFCRIWLQRNAVGYVFFALDR